MRLPVVESTAAASPWYAGGLKFTCTQCGNCCTGGPGYVWISDVELERLAAHLNQPLEQVLRTYCRKIGGRVSLKERRTPQGNYDCVFLREEPGTPRPDGGVVQPRRICTLYPVRPLQCRTWPFWDGLLASPEAWRAAGARCPGIDREGRTYTLSQIEQLHRAQDWPDAVLPESRKTADEPDKR